MFKEIKKGENIQFGSFTWRVLDIVDEKALLITEEIICLANSIYGKLDVGYKLIDKSDCFAATKQWRSSYVRAYFKGDFLNNFSKAEQELIVDSLLQTKYKFVDSVSDADSESYDYETIDKVFLLDAVEAEKYFRDDADRIAFFKCSDGYLPWGWRLRDAWSYDEYDRGGPRTYLAEVNEDGQIYGSYHGYIGLRPAIWVRVEK